ncbi:MAG: CRISPR-associated protein Cas4 [Thermaerobacter sp.]|nr:CRISPR-associated protein Cas4 [Thermaerobacter sp.]
MANSNYSDEVLLLLSGIQHFAFCERQWSLIHIEQVWQENLLTVEGHHFHEKVDDPFGDESRGDLRIVRSMPIMSRTLGLQGVADMVEFRKQSVRGPDVVSLGGIEGYWRPRPVEFKRGKPKPDDRDAVQLCAQAICVEEMMQTSITHGDIYYWQTRRRQTVEFSSALRTRTRELAARMHELFEAGITATNVKNKPCQNCSLKDVCQPKLLRKRQSVAQYISSMLLLGEEAYR